MKIRANVTKVNNESSHVKAYADITLENCCTLYGMRVVEGRDGQMFAAYPQKPVFENGQQKMNADGKPVYTDVFFANSKEGNEAIKKLVLDAYNSEKGYAYLNPKEGERVNAKIEPKLHACHGEKTKAAGRLTIGGYMVVPDVFVNLRTDKDGDKFLAVSYPSYKSGDNYRDFVEPLVKGKIWDSKDHVEKDYNFQRAVEGAMKKQTLEFHPELRDLLKGNVNDLIAEATEASKETAGEHMDAPEMERAM